MHRLATTLWVATLTVAIHARAAAPAYHVERLDAPGTIHGTVRCTTPWHEQLPITKDPSHCGGGHCPSPRLACCTSGGVANAVVYLEGCPRGKEWDRTAVTLTQRRCSYDPHILIAPYGGAIDIVNADPVLHNVHGYDLTRGGASLFNVAQPLRGQHSTISLRDMPRPGIVALSCDAGHPWMSGYVVVAAHPYYAITDGHGGYTLRDVPPGTYTLHMWHEGVHIADRELEQGRVRKYAYEPAYEETRQITVGPGGDVAADFSFALRAAGDGMANR